MIKEAVNSIYTVYAICRKCFQLLTFITKFKTVIIIFFFVKSNLSPTLFLRSQFSNSPRSRIGCILSSAYHLLGKQNFYESVISLRPDRNLYTRPMNGWNFFLSSVNDPTLSWMNLILTIFFLFWFIGGRSLQCFYWRRSWYSGSYARGAGIENTR